MAEATIPSKDPSDILPVGFDAKAYLRKSLNETIESVEWTSSPSGLSLTNGEVDGSVLFTVVSGGSAETTYEVTAHFTTSLGYEYERTLELPVEHR